MNYGTQVSIPKTLPSPLPFRIKVKYGKHWYPTMGWRNFEPRGWWVWKKDGMMELMRCKRVKRFKSKIPLASDPQQAGPTKGDSI